MRGIKWLMLATVSALGLVLFGCEKPADVASRNISLAADNFEIARRVSFINGITGDIMLEIEGLCSLGNFDSVGQLTVTCKDGKEYKKHFLGLSDNVTFVAQQLEGVDVSSFHHRVMLRPQSILPDIDFQGDVDELTTNRN